MPLQQVILWGVFFFLSGACVGSFLNVVIWHLPHRGREVEFLSKKGHLTLSWPPSHCPVCDKPIHWYQNIPIFSYIALRARCANCKVHIPIRYPLVELSLLLLWGGLFLAYFVAHIQEPFPWQTGAGVNNLPTDWPVYLLHGLFASALLAASAMDADLFIIPLAVTWFLAILGVVASVGTGIPFTAHDFAIIPGIPEKFWFLAKPTLGAFAGLVLANILLWTGILPRAFPWELDPSLDAPSDDSAKPKKKKDQPQDPEATEALAPPPKLTRYGASVIAALILVALIITLWLTASPHLAALATVAGAILIFLIGVLPRDAGQVDCTDEVMEEISGPGVRREILKEALFLALPFAAAALASVIPADLPKDIPWLSRLLGSLLGLMVGGGIVWLIRVGGSLAFNKQAMGIGDVHLMAGVGAVIGAPLVLVAFFVAPFIGILWALVLKILGKPNVLPYGPWLSVASIMSLFLGNPILDWYLGTMMIPSPGIH